MHFLNSVFTITFLNISNFVIAIKQRLYGDYYIHLSNLESSKIKTSIVKSVYKRTITVEREKTIRFKRTADFFFF